MCTKTNGVYSYKDSNLAHRSSPKTSSAHAKNSVAQPSSFFHSVFVDTLCKKPVGILFFKTPTSCCFYFLVSHDTQLVPSGYHKEKKRKRKSSELYIVQRPR